MQTAYCILEMLLHRLRLLQHLLKEEKSAASVIHATPLTKFLACSLSAGAYASNRLMRNRTGVVDESSQRSQQDIRRRKTCRSYTLRSQRRTGCCSLSSLSRALQWSTTLYPTSAPCLQSGSVGSAASPCLLVHTVPCPYEAKF